MIATKNFAKPKQQDKNNLNIKKEREKEKN